MSYFEILRKTNKTLLYLLSVLLTYSIKTHLMTQNFSVYLKISCFSCSLKKTPIFSYENKAVNNYYQVAMRLQGRNKLYGPCFWYTACSPFAPTESLL